MKPVQGIRILFALSLFLAVLAVGSPDQLGAAASAGAAAPAGSENLYKRLGGYDAIAAVCKVPQKEKDELLAAISTLKADIVEKP